MIKQVYFCFYISSFLLFFLPCLNAQENLNSYLSIDNGLVNNEVTSIKQDKFGFLWVGTRGGLNKYDGYSLTLLRNKPNSTNNLSSQAVESIFAGKKNLWIGTKTGGLNRYDYLKDSIYNYNFPSVDGVIDIFSLLENHDGELLIGSSKGLYCLDYKTNKFKLIDNYIVNDMAEDGYGGFWAATTIGLMHYDKTEKLIYQNKFGIGITNLTSIAIDYSKKTIYLGTWGKGVLIFDIQKQIFKSLLHNPNNPNTITSNNTYRVFLDNSDNLWVGTWGGGLNKYHINSQSVSKYILSSTDNYNYANKIILSIEQDQSGLMWIGTEGGVYKINPQKKQFNNITYRFNQPNSIGNTNITSILKDNNGALWVGTKDGGLEYSSDLKNFIKVDLPFTYKRNERISAIFQNGNEIWIGSNDGLFIIKGRNISARINHYISKSSDEFSVGNKITSIIKDSKGIIWMGTQEKGLNRVTSFDPKGKPLVKRYPVSGKPNDIQSERITCLFNDKMGRLWIGSFNGLHLYNRKDDSFINFKHSIKDTTSISNSIIVSIAQDKVGQIWIGTPNGLNKLIEGKDNKFAFKNYFADDNFPNDYVHAILPDNKSKIWISTNKGISSYNMLTDKFSNYDMKDGLLSNAFSENAGFVDHNGMLYFGGIKGITYFHPNDIKINNKVPPIFFTNILINNIPINVGQEVEGSIPLKNSLFSTKNITLNYKQNLFTISFAALDYHASGKNQYRYRLKGFNNEWTNAGRRRNVTYTNLPSGDYTLEVKASNNDNIWNEEAAEIEITVLPPPWKTWWAKSLYILFFIFLLWLSRYIGLNRLKLKNKLEIANISLKREREILELKNKLFTNISHEFRTPLTLMIGPLDDLSKVENLNFGVRKTVLRVQDQTKRLLNLVNQLLDFQKAESGKLTLNASVTNIVSFIKEIFYSFKNESQRRDIKFQFYASSDQINVEFDQEKMTIVLYNLLSNAFKFSDEGATINLSINEISEENESKCEIIVSDTGKGINESEREKIFDRFYQSAKAEAGKFAGTGIGLAFTKDLLLLHNGSITVDSALSEGSTFRILLPIKNAMSLNNQDIAEEKTMVEAIEIHQVEDKPIEADDEDLHEIVLIVEDNMEVNEYLVSLFKSTYKTYSTFNGKEGLNFALDNVPDIIISDVMMPEMNGYELCSLLKSSLPTSHVPVILLTAQSDADSQIEGVERGADVYLSKPFNPEVLRSHVKNLLSSRSKLKELFAQKINLGPSEVEITSFESEFIKKVIEVIEENIANPDFQKDVLANELNMSRSTFYRKLKAITDMSGSEFIRFIKIKRSAQLLLSGEFNIKQVAYEVGFNDAKHFRKCFINQFNVTPSEYIKREKS